MTAGPSADGLPDVLGPGLTVLFIGFNPGLRSGETGHHYAGRNNRFWDLLFDSGLAPRRLQPEEDACVLGLGFGLTNIVARITAGSGDLRRADYAAGAAELRRKVGLTGPRIACYMGKGIYAQLSGFKSVAVDYGLQQGSIFDGPADFVAPSPSGRASIPYRDKLAVMVRLADLVRWRESPAAPSASGRAWPPAFPAWA